ncbi:DUF3616 domain-containing protein [Bradyrhizobium liaoningense]|uniref:DUF3616 domain-containing protein n=1 Tax=Bradyrhizobium liaoningense TaxID=43992 RepID=UPI001BAC3459|nr:DUF3616 domain-containing protein [Bradyrhizobium liaoningense]MBR1034182.1 DUF3616 domain-containing protein [Bradyrhizobium liaoningense]
MAIKRRSVWLDYKAASEDAALVPNMSAIVWADPHLWTASDEGRTVECLEPHRGGFRLLRQFGLDEIFDHLPGKKDGNEIDLESLDFRDGELWLCGSHCIVRKQARKSKASTVDPKFRERKSRRLLGRVAVDSLLNERPRSYAVPLTGRESLRERLAGDPFIRPFVGLPSKENGLDVEGLAIGKNRLFIGLRGPVVDSIALVAELSLTSANKVSARPPILHFLDLHGLGVRDLTVRGESIFVLAGPVTAAHGPFQLYQWSRRKTKRIQRPARVYGWPNGSVAPEGICFKDGELLVVYDIGDDDRRIRGARYRTDIFKL